MTRGLVYAELFETRRRADARLEVIPRNVRLCRRKRDDVSAPRGIRVARLELLTYFLRLLPDLLFFGDEHLKAVRRPEELEYMGSGVIFRGHFVVKQLAHGNDQQLIGRAR